MTVLEIYSRALSALMLENIASICLMEASSLEKLHVPPFSPEMDALIVGIKSRETTNTIMKILGAVYPSEFKVKGITLSANSPDVAYEFPLTDLVNECAEGEYAIFIPALPPGSAFEKFQDIIAHLRAPDGCPWDMDQTHLSLRKHLIEESYETLDALDSGDPLKMKEEFGDLLLQIVLNAQIASEAGEFTMTEIIQGIHDKIIRRHPHIFSDVVVNGVGNVLQNWEKIKADERESKGDAETGLMDGLPVSLPALVQAQEMQSRAARVGFDWPEIDGVLDKVREEIEEIRETSNKAELADELGDLLFALVNLARWKGIDAESALRDANRKFKKRFAFVENGAKGLGRNLSDLSLEEMEVFWQSAKDLET